VKVAMLTREYPPEVYGGAGVHVEYLSRALRKLADVEVRCFGGRRDKPGVLAYEPWRALGGPEPYRSALEVLSVDLAMVAGIDADVVHSHTWYANLAGHLAKLTHGIPHVATTHSLEPLRPWKAEQLGPGGYAISTFCERTALEGADAVVAVSEAMREDMLRAYPSVEPSRVQVVHNGIDPDEYRPDPGTAALERHGVDPERPSVVFVGRVTRQKGLIHLLDAADDLDRDAQLVICAGTPDSEQAVREVTERRAEVRREIVWIEGMLPRRDVIQLLSHATAMCVPSIYEPFGIVCLEGSACGTAVVATATGGIPEAVAEGETGLLVEPGDGFAGRLAARLNELVHDPERARRMGRAGRSRVLERFTWDAVAKRTLELYRRLSSGSESHHVSPEEGRLR
jgi:starch synthase